MSALIVGLLWCVHARTGDTCPDCRLIEAGERGLQIGTPVVTDLSPEPVLAEADVMIERTDLSVPARTPSWGPATRSPRL